MNIESLNKTIMRKTVLLICLFVGILTSMAQESKSAKFMLLVHSDKNQMTEMSSKHQKEHIQKVGAYIGELAKSGKLIDAQPLAMEGALVTAHDGKVDQKKLTIANKAIAGYYIIQAKGLEEAIAIAKADPRFEANGWKLEVRPIKQVSGIN